MKGNGIVNEEILKMFDLSGKVAMIVGGAVYLGFDMASVLGDLTTEWASLTSTNIDEAFVGLEGLEGFRNTVKDTLAQGLRYKNDLKRDYQQRYKDLINKTILTGRTVATKQLKANQFNKPIKGSRGIISRKGLSENQIISVLYDLRHGDQEMLNKPEWKEIKEKEKELSDLLSPEGKKFLSQLPAFLKGIDSKNPLPEGLTEEGLPSLLGLTNRVDLFLEETSREQGMKQFNKLAEGVLLNDDVLRQMSKTFGEKFVKNYKASIEHMIKPEMTKQQKTLDTLRAYASMSLLSFNYLSGMSQMIGAIPNRAMQMDLDDPMGFFQALGSAFNPRLLKKIATDKDILERLFGGYDEATVNATRSDFLEGLNRVSPEIKTFADALLYLPRKGFTFPASGDYLMNVIIGAVRYTYLDNSGKYDYLTADAKDNAIMARIVQEAQETQQAGDRMLYNRTQRGGSFQKTFTQFLSAPQIALSSYNMQMRKGTRLFDQGKTKEAAKEYIKAAIIQHLVVGGTYLAIDAIRSGLTREEDDEESLARVSAQLAFSPFGGSILGAMTRDAILDDWKLGKMPIVKLFKDINKISGAIMDVMNDEEEMEKVMEEILNLAPPFKQTKKILDKHFD